MVTIPENFLDLLTAKKAFANIATVMKDGSPQVTPIWFEYTDGKIRVNTTLTSISWRKNTWVRAVILSANRTKFGSSPRSNQCPHKGWGENDSSAAS